MDKDKINDLNKYSIINLKDFDINNYYKNKGIDHIKDNMKITKIDDPVIDLILEEEAKKIMTPLEEWNIRGFINNNK